MTIRVVLSLEDDWWRARALELDVTMYAETREGAIAALGRMFDAIDTACTPQAIKRWPPAAIDSWARWLGATPFGSHPLGTRHVGDVRIV